MMIKKKYIFIFITILIIAFYLISKTDFIYHTKVVYTTKYTEKKEKVTVDNIAKEKGQDVIYTISTDSGTRDITKKIYNKYIGDDYNTITIREEALEVCIAKGGLFNTNFNECKTYSVYRYSYPWDKAPEKYTNENIKEVVDVIKEVGGFFYDYWFSTDLAFEYDRKGCGYMSKNPLNEEGYIRYHEDY